MVTVPVLMLRGHAINMWWKTQLHFPAVGIILQRNFDYVLNIKMAFGMVSVK